MGPRSIDRGIVLTLPRQTAIELLQWGRDQLIAELGLGTVSVRTMARLQWGRDQLIAELLPLVL